MALHRKITVTAGIAAGIIFALFVAAKTFFIKPKETVKGSVTVVPQVDGEKSKVAEDTSVVDEDTALVSLVNLNPDETLLGVVSMDFDSDGFDDQVIIVKNGSSPYIQLVVGLYNNKKNVYERVASIPTEISQTKTFSYTGLDLTGDHRTALLYQGFAENGDSLLSAWFINRINDRVLLKSIANLRGDGTIFIQQIDRYDEYERTKANGESFPIWVYTSDVENPSSNDQLQIQYDWSAEEGVYVQKKLLRVTGSKLAANELARIQDGTVETFANYLNGLWHKFDSAANEEYFLFFDYEQKEVVFFKDDTQEIYNWVQSNIRRNGMYLSTVNQEIENLNRRVDVSLRNVDEIYLRLQDDVRMIISESNLWDGNYKKVSKETFYKSENEKNKFVKTLSLYAGTKWKSSEGILIEFYDGSYKAVSETLVDAGFFSELMISKSLFVQFKSNTENSFFNGMYRLNVTSEKEIIFEPYTVKPNGVYPAPRHSIILTKQ